MATCLTKRGRAALVHYDYTVLAGTQGGRNHYKQDRIFELCHRFRLPLVLFGVQAIRLGHGCQRYIRAQCLIDKFTFELRTETAPRRARLDRNDLVVLHRHAPEKNQEHGDGDHAMKDALPVRLSPSGQMDKSSVRFEPG